jgi:hypothetical protein
MKSLKINDKIFLTLTKLLRFNIGKAQGPENWRETRKAEAMVA